MNSLGPCKRLRRKGKIDELTAQKASLEAENKQLRKQVEWLRKAQFGRKSETKKVVYPEEQMSLFNEAETEAKPSAPEPEISVKPHKRKKKVGHREELLAKLPHQKIVVEPETTVCPEYGSTLSPVGEELVIPHSIASPSVVAHVMMQKYGYALPLYRQESEWKRIGLAFSRANLANWIIIASKEWLARSMNGCMRYSWKSAVSMLMKHPSRCTTKKAVKIRASHICGSMPARL